MIGPIQKMDLEQTLKEMIDEQRRKEYKITDLSSLTWAMRKLSAIEAKKAEVNQVADQEIAHIESYRKSELEKLADSEAFFNSLINDYANEQRATDPKYKSEKTPYGSIGFVKQQPKWKYQDEALVEFLEKNNYSDLVRVKKEPVKTEIKKMFTVNDDGRVYDENGQEVEGITVEFLPEQLRVKVGE